MRLQLFCFAFIILLIYNKFAPASSASKCYACSTSMDPNCNDPFTNSTQQICQSLDNKNYNCIKYSYLRDEKTIIFRSCKAADVECKDLEDTFKIENRKILKCSTCSEDLCNSAHRNYNQIIALVIIIISLVLVNC